MRTWLCANVIRRMPPERLYRTRRLIPSTLACHLICTSSFRCSGAMTGDDDVGNGTPVVPSGVLGRTTTANPITQANRPMFCWHCDHSPAAVITRSILVC